MSMPMAAWHGPAEACGPEWLVQCLEKSAKDAMPCDISDVDSEWDGYVAEHYAEATCVLPKTPFEGKASQTGKTSEQRAGS
jgi:hypothetical protein